ncbi:MAG: chemotaxis protein CheX [Magnetococcales bacterium]|nr:chemotaxis protein CheX [Magnetococcales bacterium]MBF0151494.1 chemotaxis protein CheX [Magnetococcales bacterium]MBF0173711.1 chemotaxis protein CheX [Magnetococcales bacterium]MBF0632444.1 chemotaxis protein CheX [Magnetococcales bacterium]
MIDSLLAALSEAVIEIAQTMLFIEIAVGPSRVQGELQNADVSAVVGYGGGLNGGLRLGGSLEVALRLAGALVGEPRIAWDQELEDAFGEMANMIAGGVQSRVEATLGPITLTPPMVIQGKNHQITGQQPSSRLCQDFEIDGVVFFCEIYFTLPA